MNRAAGKGADDAVTRQSDLPERGIVCEHGDDRFRGVACIGNPDRCMRAQLQQLIAFCRAAIEHGDIVSGLHQVCSHRRAHVAQPDESNLHLMISVVASRGSGALQRRHEFRPDRIGNRLAQDVIDP